MRSIRGRLVLGILLGLSALCFIVAGGVFLHVRASLVRQFDAGLAGRARDFADMTQVERRGAGALPEPEFDEFPLAEFMAGPDCSYYQLWREGGDVVVRSPSLGDSDLAVPEPVKRKFETGDLVLPDGRSGRFCTLGFSPAPDDGVDIPGYDPEAPENGLVLVVASSREDLDQTIGVLFTGFLAIVLVLPIGALLVVLWGVKRGLAPLDAIARKAGELQPDELDYRFPVEEMPAELQRVCLRLNELLERVQSTLVRERRFSADVAHELRTPISELRALTEVGLKWKPEQLPEEDPCAYFRDALGIAEQMERHVTTLLSLVRSRSGRQGIQLGPVELAGLIRETWDLVRAGAEARGLLCELDLPKSFSFESDRELMSAIMRNLVQNAVTYTPDRGTVQCKLNRNGSGFEFSITNASGDLSEEDIAHVTEPFWRKDPARSKGEHAGLGLSLVAAYAELLGLDLQAELEDGMRFRVTLSTA